MKGWTGKTLAVDLSRMEVRVVRLPEEAYERFIGGTGLNAWLLWQEVPPEVAPLSPENPLIFGFGPLVGTQTYCGNRFTVTFKSPLTGIYGDANAGGDFAPEVKFAGYDAIIVRGQAEKPVYLWINNDQAQLRDAGHLWGKDTWETEDLIRKELGDPKVKTVSIGPAGENLVKYAVLVATGDRVAGRCGAGCLAGYKRLKAIAVRGTGEVQVHDPAYLSESFRKAQVMVNSPENLAAQNYRRAGTLSVLRSYSTAVGCAAVRNFQDNVYAKYSEIDGEAFNAKLKSGTKACFRCPLGCEQRWQIKEGKFAGESGKRLELCTVMAFGTVVDNPDLAAIAHLQNLTARLGIDVNELGATFGMAMECWERGILTRRDTGGIALDWGNVDSMIELTRLIAYRKGFGNVLAEGVKGAAEAIGRGAPQYAMHVKGLAMTPEEVKTTQTRALSFAVNVRGGDHLKGSASFEKVTASVEIVRAIFGTTDVAMARSPEAKGRAVWWQENQKALIDSLELCSFLPRQIGLLFNRERQFAPLYQMFVKATGSPMDFDEFLRCGERIVQLQRAFNAREGISRKDDTLPKRLLAEPAPSDPGKGMVARLEHKGMLPEYYAFRGCDQNGLPMRARLAEVGLNDVANELARQGKLSLSLDRTERFSDIKRCLI